MSKINKIIILLLSIITLFLGYSNNITYAYNSAYTSISNILNNTDDKVFVSEMYENDKGEKYMVIITKDYKGLYKLNYLIYDKNINNFVIKQKYTLYNKNFYKNNLFIFDDNFLYLESGNDNKVYFYDKNKSYALDEDIINSYFGSDLTDTDEEGNILPDSLVYGAHMVSNNSIYSFQTNDNIRNFLLANTVYIGTSKKSLPFFYKNGIFYFYNTNLVLSAAEDVSKLYHKKDVSDFGYDSLFCKGSMGKHNYIISFDLTKESVNIIPMEDADGNRICYFDTNNASLSYKTIWSNISNDNNLLLYFNSDLTNNDNYLNIYKFKLNNSKIVGQQEFQTKVMDSLPLDISVVLDENFQNKHFNTRKYTNIYEDKVFIVFYYKKNDFNTLVIYNKETGNTTEFKDITTIKKIASNIFNGNRNIEISYYKKLSGLEKIQVSKILDTDKVLNIATMNKTAKVEYVYKGLFNNILAIIDKEYLYYKFLGYYNIVGKTLFSPDKKFFVDYQIESINNNSLSYLVINKKNYTNKINNYLAGYKNKGIEITKIGNLKLLDDGYLLINFEYQKDKIKLVKRMDVKTKKMITVKEKVKVKGNKYILFTGNKILEIPENKNSIQFLYIFPIAQKIFLGYKGLYYIGDIRSGIFKQIKIVDGSVTTILSSCISSINMLGEQKDKIVNPIIDYKDGYIYIINKNDVKKINLSTGNSETIINGNIQKIYNYNGYIILYNIDNFGTNNLFVDYTKKTSGNFLGLKIYDNILFLFNKKDLVIVTIKKILEKDKIVRFNNLIDSYILGLKNPTTLYYYNLFKDVIYKLNNKSIDRQIIMNLFYKHYLNSK